MFVTLRRSLGCGWLVLAAVGCTSQPGAEPAVPTAGSALYRVTLEASWSTATHANFSAGGHFSALIGLSHRGDELVFRPGQLASLGIKNVAELGANGALRAEISLLYSNGAALRLLDGRGGTPSPGTLTDTIRLDAAHPRLTVVTMIAPRPDWFAALEDENLLGADGQWVAARAHDADTDSGPTFTAPDQPPQPAEPIRPLRLSPRPVAQTHRTRRWANGTSNAFVSPWVISLQATSC